MHTVLEAKDQAFCKLCEKLHRQQTWDGGYYKPVTSENHRERTGGGDKYQDFVSWFKKDKCWKPSWLNSIGLNVGPDVRINVSPDVDVGSDVGSDVGLDVGSDVGSNVRSEVRLDV